MFRVIGSDKGCALTTMFARKALLENGWAENVRLEMTSGLISAVETGGPSPRDAEIVEIAVPGMPNLHSHAFQRAMAGLAEVRGPSSDSFWSWRTVMYDFALSMNPDDIEAVAAQLYMEMLEAGFTRVGEFHYLHHARNGSHYDNIAEHAERIAAASQSSGIGLTLLPVFYAHAGFGGETPSDGQRRFINSIDSFEKLVQACQGLVAGVPGANLGLAPHSLRAVTPEELSHLEQMAGDGPIHIHVAEQTREVDECVAWSGKRPVEWLLDNARIDQRWCLIHATHMTDAETREMAASGAIAGLCPITEANLGDGIFPAGAFLAAGGAFGIGSDSNISISVAHELRQLEYSQRLAARARNVIADKGHSTGAKLFSGAMAGGSAALSTKAGLAVGASADIVALDAGQALPTGPDQLLDQWIFADGVKIDSVWSRGKKVVADGAHIDRERISDRFRETMAALMNGHSNH